MGGSSAERAGPRGRFLVSRRGVAPEQRGAASVVDARGGGLPAFEGRHRPVCVVVADDESCFVNVDRLLANGTDPLAFHDVKPTRFTGAQSALARYCEAMAHGNAETLRSFYEGLNSTG